MSNIPKTPNIQEIRRMRANALTPSKIDKKAMQKDRENAKTPTNTPKASKQTRKGNVLDAGPIPSTVTSPHDQYLRDLGRDEAENGDDGGRHLFEMADEYAGSRSVTPRPFTSPPSPPSPSCSMPGHATLKSPSTRFLPASLRLRHTSSNLARKAIPKEDEFYFRQRTGAVGFEAPEAFYFMPEPVAPRTHEDRGQRDVLKKEKYDPQDHLDWKRHEAKRRQAMALSENNDAKLKDIDTTADIIYRRRVERERRAWIAEQEKNQDKRQGQTETLRHRINGGGLPFPPNVDNASDRYGPGSIRQSTSSAHATQSEASRRTTQSEVSTQESLQEQLREAQARIAELEGQGSLRLKGELEGQGSLRLKGGRLKAALKNGFWKKSDRQPEEEAKEEKEKEMEKEKKEEKKGEKRGTWRKKNSLATTFMDSFSGSHSGGGV